MSKRAFAISVLVTVGLLAVRDIGGQDRYEPGRSFLLVQSELDYLVVSRQPITVVRHRATVGEILEDVGKSTGLTIVLKHKPPPDLVLDIEFRNRSVKEVLTWLAGKARLYFRVTGPERLVVFGDDDT